MTDLKTGEFIEVPIKQIDIMDMAKEHHEMKAKIDKILAMKPVTVKDVKEPYSVNWNSAVGSNKMLKEIQKELR